MKTTDEEGELAQDKPQYNHPFMGTQVRPIGSPETSEGLELSQTHIAQILDCFRKVKISVTPNLITLRFLVTKLLDGLLPRTGILITLVRSLVRHSATLVRSSSWKISQI